MPQSSFVDTVLWGPFGGLDNVFCDRSFRASAGPTSANKFPPHVKNTAVGKTQVWRALTFRELPGATGIASIGSCMQKLRLVEKYIKYQHTRGRNVNVSWFGVTRTPEDAPKTPEDAPVVFVDTVLRGPFGGLDNIFCDRSLSC